MLTTIDNLNIKTQKIQANKFNFRGSPIFIGGLKSTLPLPNLLVASVADL
jgi:hypothetical protein